jgi:hypothetical protein
MEDIIAILRRKHLKIILSQDERHGKTWNILRTFEIHQASSVSCCYYLKEVI